MKKYWKTILLSVVIIISITIFYTYSNVATKDLPYKIETISGDENELKNVVFSTNYPNISGSVNRKLQISKDGIKEAKNEFFLGMPIYRELGEPFSRYIKEYRQYMRGKELILGLYGEDEERLIYVNGVRGKNYEPYPILQVNILNKKTNDQLAFQVDLPETHTNFSVQDVNMHNGQIQIVANVFKYNGGGELHLYTIDEKSKRLVYDEQLNQDTFKKGIVSQCYFFNDVHLMQNDDYYVYGVENSKARIDNYGEDDAVISKDLYIYNVQTKQQKKIEVPPAIKNYMFYETMYGKDIQLLVPVKEGLEVWRYQLATATWSKSVRIENIKVNRNYFSYKIKNEKLYVMNYVSNELVIIICDLKTGELLYKGKMVGENIKNLNLYLEFEDTSV